jgi:hypothetical protein
MMVPLDDHGAANAPAEPPAEKRREAKPAPRSPANRTGGDVAKLDGRGRNAGGGGAKANLEDGNVAGRGGRYTSESTGVGVADSQQQKPLEIAAPDPAPPKRPAPAKDPAPAPAPPPPGVADAPAMAGEVADEDRDAAETIDTATTKAEIPTQPRGPSLDQLTRQARTAARAGDCGVVKTLARKVRAASADYYKRSFATDADIKKCL